MIDEIYDAIEVADKILLKWGRISLSEIRRMPQVDNEKEVIAVAQSLIDKYEEVQVIEDRWKREFTLYLTPSAVKRARAEARRRKPPLRQIVVG